MTLPLKDLDDRRFDELFRDARRRIPLYLREWTDHNESDPGIALLQLFAWLTEATIFRLNQVPDERMYRAFLNLVGVERSPALPARSAVAFEVEPGTPPHTLDPPELLLGASVDGEEVYFEPEAPVPLVGAEVSALLTDDRAHPQLLDRMAANQEATSSFAPFGATGARDAALYIGLDSSRGGVANPLVEPGGAVPIQLLSGRLVAGDATEPQSTTVEVPGRTTRSGVVFESWDGKQWIGLEAVDESGGLERSGQIRLVLTGDLRPRTLPNDPDPRDRYWIRIVAREPAAVGLRIRHLAINATRVGQWRTVAQELLPPGSDGRPDQERTVQSPPILLGEDAPVRVFVGDEARPWEGVAELPRRPTAPGRLFAVRDATTLVFGDGENALIPPRGLNNLRVSYRSGGGKRGNDLDDLSLLRSPPDVNGVVSLTRSAGGSDEQSVQDVQQSAGERLRTLGRAVTPRDFEVLAVERGGAARAIGLNRVDPRYPGIDVTSALSLVVIPPQENDDPAPMPSTTFLRAVADQLEPFRVLTSELWVVPPRYRTVEVRGRLSVTRGADVADVKEKATAMIRLFLHPLTGGPEESGWPIGRPVGYGELVSRLVALRDVRSVDKLSIHVDGRAAPPFADAEIGDHALVRAAIPQLEVRELGGAA